MTKELSDWEECELYISAMLSDDEMTAINGVPVWELDHPQREEYLSPSGYAMGMKRYAERLLTREMQR